MSNLRLGIASSIPTKFFVSGLRVDGAVSVVEAASGELMSMVRCGEVDIALVSTLSVVADSEGLEVVPAVALSSWHYPFAQVYLPAGLTTPPEKIYCHPAHVQEAFLSLVVLREHYKMEPELVVTDEDFAEDDAAICVGNEIPFLKDDGRGSRLDLGQEWFELASYPMVWHVFVMRKGEVTSNAVALLRDMAERSERLRSHWADSKDYGPALRHFFSEDVRVRFDDLATASITELLDYAFYYDFTDEIVDFPVAHVEIDDSDDSVSRPLL